MFFSFLSMVFAFGTGYHEHRKSFITGYLISDSDSGSQGTYLSIYRPYTSKCSTMPYKIKSTNIWHQKQNNEYFASKSHRP